MPIDCVAVVGKQNNALYIRNFSGTLPDLKYHYVVHTSLDIVDDKLSVNAKGSQLYLGHLHTIEDIQVFGYALNSQVKFIVGVTAYETQIKDQDMRALFAKMHSYYIEAVCNPFCDVEDMKALSSPKFDARVARLVKSSNGL